MTAIGVSSDHPVPSLNNTRSFAYCQKCHTVQTDVPWATCSGYLQNEISQWYTWGFGIQDTQCRSEVCDDGTSCTWECPAPSGGYDCYWAAGEYPLLNTVTGTRVWNSWPGDNWGVCTSDASWDECQDGYSFNYSNDWVQCTSLVEDYSLDWSSCSYDTSTSYDCTRCHYSLVLDSISNPDYPSCETNCPKGYYIDTTIYNTNSGTYEDNICTQCVSPCAECIDEFTCLSCESDYYLSYYSQGGSIGYCVQKSESVQDIVLFVSPEYEETDGVGTYIDPFGNIVKALSAANERAANMTGGNVSISIILLGGGSHYMTTNIDHYDYNKSKADHYSYDKDILIQPAFCGQTYGQRIFGPSDSDCIQSSEQITVYYKMANSFYFLVPNSLTLRNIIFDAIDSSINPYDDCLRENAV